MSGQTLTRRAVIAACGALAVAGQAALAQSGQAVRNIRVDVAPLRANAGDPTATGSSRSFRAGSRRRWPAA